MPYDHILVASDFSAAAREAYRVAAALAAALDARVTVLHVDDSTREDAEKVETERFLEMARSLRERGEAHARRDLNALGVDPAVEIVPGSPKQAIDAWIREHDADLLVMTRHRGESGRGEWLLGSTCLGLLQISSVPVLVVSADAAAIDPDTPVHALTGISRILAPVDFSEQSVEALPHIAALARRLGATVATVHVVEPRFPQSLIHPRDSDSDEAMDARCREARERLEALGREHLGGEAEARAVAGRKPALAILDAAEETGADLVVMPTTGKGAVARTILGSTSKQVIRLSDRPVLGFPPSSLPKGD